MGYVVSDDLLENCGDLDFSLFLEWERERERKSLVPEMPSFRN